MLLPSWLQKTRQSRKKDAKEQATRTFGLLNVFFTHAIVLFLLEVIHAIVCVTPHAIVLDEVVALQATFDDAPILIFINLVVYFGIFFLLE